MPIVEHPSLGEIEFGDDVSESDMLKAISDYESSQSQPPTPQRPLTLEDYNVTGPSRRPSTVAAPVTDDSNLRASEASNLGFEVPTPEDEEYWNQPTLSESRPESAWHQFRRSTVGRKMMGPTEEQKAGFMEGQRGDIGLLEIPSAMMHMTSVPPQFQAPVRSITEPAIKLLPAGAQGVVRGVRETALNLPIAPIPGGAGKAVLPLFAGEYAMGLPEAGRAYKEAIDRGDTAAANQILTETAGGGALLGLGAKHEFSRGRQPTLADYEQARAAREVPQKGTVAETTAEPTLEVQKAEAAPVVEEAPPDLSMFKEAPTLQLTPTMEYEGKLYRGPSHAEITKDISRDISQTDPMAALEFLKGSGEGKYEANKGFIDEANPNQFLTRKEASPLFLEASGLKESQLHKPEIGLSSEDLVSSQMHGHVEEAVTKAKERASAPKPSESAPVKDLPAEGKIASVDDAGNVKVYKKSGKRFTQVSLADAKAQGIPVPEKVPASRAEWIEGMGEAEHQRLFGKPKEQSAAQEAPATSEFRPPATPEFQSLEEAVKYRNDYRDSELTFLKSLGLSERDAGRLMRSYDDRSNTDAAGIVEKLSPEAKKRLEEHESSKGRELYQYDRTYDPERLVGETNKATLASEIVGNLARGESLPAELGDRMIHAIAALRQLEKSGGTWSDVARALDEHTTRISGSQGDKASVFSDYGQRIKAFAEKAGIELPQGELGVAKSIMEPVADPNTGAMHSGLGIVPPGFTSTKAIADAIQKVPAEFQAFRDNLAGKSAPRTSRASQESGNKLVQFAASKIAAPLVARFMATQVLGPHHKDAAFGQKLGAVLVEDRLRAIHDSFVKAGDAQSATDVETVIGKPWSPFAAEADFRAALADPAITAAIERHKATVQPEAQEAHEMARGELSGPGLNTGAFVNLKAIGENIADVPVGGAARGNPENPLRRISKFFKQAKGNAAKYEVDYRTLAERMVEGNFQEAAKRRMYDQLVKDGLAVIADPGDPVPVIGKDKPIRFTIERRGTPMGEGGARTYIQNLWVRRDIAPELRQALDVDGAVGKAGLTTAAEIINRIQLAGPTDAVWHTANMLGSIAGSQGGKNVLVDLARKLPGVNLFDAIGRVTMRGMEVMRDSPEIQQQLAELAKIGALRGREHSGWAGKAINFVDKAGRLVRDDMYQNLVDRGLVRESEATRREWVNQMGQYNPRLMGQFQRFFRESGFSPFIVAGRNFNRMAMRRLAMSPGIEAASPAAAAKLRTVEALGLFTTLVVIPSLINYAITGNPNGRPGTKFGQIDTGKDDGEGKNVVIDPAQWSGIRRGLRISGLGAAIEGIRHHEGSKRITKDVSRDILGGLTHPWTGPMPRTAAVATTGYDPSFYRQSVDPGDVGENVKSALHELNPAIGAVMEANKKDTAPAKELGYQLGGAVGLKRVSPYTEPRQLADKAREWLRTNKFKLALDEPGYGTDYTRLRQAVRDGKEKTALELMENLRYGKGELGGRSDATIAKAMQAYAKAPFTGSKEKERAFYDSLSEKDQALYDKAMEAKAAEFERFIQFWEGRPERRETE